MPYYDIINVFEEIDFNKTSASEECDFVIIGIFQIDG